MQILPFWLALSFEACQATSIAIQILFWKMWIFEFRSKQLRFYRTPCDGKISKSSSYWIFVYTCRTKTLPHTKMSWPIFCMSNLHFCFKIMQISNWDNKQQQQDIATSLLYPNTHCLTYAYLIFPDYSCLFDNKCTYLCSKCSFLATYWTYIYER